MVFPNNRPPALGSSPLVKQSQINFRSPTSDTPWLARLLSVGLLFCSGNVSSVSAAEPVDSFLLGASGTTENGAPESVGFVYLAEEPPLVPGRGSQMITRRIAENGATQVAQIVDDEVVLFVEGQIDTKQIFGLLAPMIGKRFVIRKRSAANQIDGLYPAFLRVFFRYRKEQGPLYADVSNAASAPIARLVEQVHAICPERAGRPPRTIFLQAAMLDEQTAGEFRRDHLLRSVKPNELESAPVTAAALREPFQLVATTETALRNDSLATQLNRNQPVIDIECDGTSFQLRSIKSRN